MGKQRKKSYANVIYAKNPRKYGKGEKCVLCHKNGIMARYMCKPCYQAVRYQQEGGKFADYWGYKRR